MRTLRTALAAAVFTTLLASCGGGTGVPVVDSADPRAEVEQVFRGYYSALLARDFAAACAHNAPQTTATLLRNLATQGVDAATCEEGLATIYTIPGAAAVADGIATTAEIQDISVTGDDASITWSAEVDGQRPTVTNGMQRVDGRWLLLDTGGAAAGGQGG